MGAGSRQMHTASLPPQQFHCLLDELPLHLIPRRLLQSRDRSLDLFQPLFFNPQCSILSQGQVPAELEPHRALLGNFSLQGTIAWVRDPATSSLHPFWLSSRMEAVVSRFRAGEPVPESFPEEVRGLLAGAGILVPANHRERRLAQWVV